MKTTLRLPTQDPYAYIEVELEVQEVSEALEAYSEAMKAIKGGGLSDKLFDAFVEKQLQGEPNQIEDLEKMNTDQRWAMQIIKRALKRIESKT